MRKWICALLAALCLWGQAYAITYRPCGKILDYVTCNLEQAGTLKQDKFGFIYVDVDNDYICKLTGLIEDAGFVEPDYFTGENRHGAHISVVYAAEASRFGVKKIDEVGLKVSFKVCGCAIIGTQRDPSIDSYYLLLIEAPELADLRKKYGLPQSKYPFHITIGVRLADLEYKDAPQALDESM